MAEASRRSHRLLTPGLLTLLLGALSTMANEQPLKNAVPNASSVARGEKLYAEACSSCHGNRADGNPAAAIPSLAGQQGTYLLKRLVAFTGAQRDAPVMHLRMASKALDSPRIWRD